MGTGSPATGDFGALLHGLRRSAGLTQEELAHAAGVSVRALSYMERGRSRGPQRRTVQALAAALCLDAAGARQLEDAASLGRSRPVTGLADEPGTDPESAPALNTLGRHLRRTGHADQALAVHRRSEALCGGNFPARSDEVLGIYLAAIRMHIGNDLAALRRWNEAETPLRQAVTAFEAARMPSWSETARLDLGITLSRLHRTEEARTTLSAAHEGLVRLNHPRQLEAATQLRLLDELDEAGGVGGAVVQGPAAEHTPSQ